MNRGYVPIAEPERGVAIRVRPSDSRVATWCEAAASALALRTAPSLAPDDDAEPSMVEVRRGTPPEPSSPEVIATDERGTLMHTDEGWRWTCPGYDLVVRDGSGSTTITLLRSLDQGRGRETTAYALRHALTVLLPRNARYPLHAAGLCAPNTDHALVLAGPSGCGKSTLTAGLVDRGWRSLSDDLLALVPGAEADRPLQAYGLTRGIRLCDDAWTRLGMTEQDDELPGGHAVSVFGSPGKRVRAPEGPSSRRGEPQWLLFPELVDQPESTLAPIDAQAALGTVLEQMQPPAALPDLAAAAQFAAAAALIRQSRCLRLHAGRDLYADPCRLAGLLSANTGVPPHSERRPAHALAP